VDPEIKAAVIGHDKYWNFFKSSAASVYLREGAKFFATDDCPFVTLENGRKYPSTGCFLESV
jgi:hypothetical protein